MTRLCELNDSEILSRLELWNGKEHSATLLVLKKRGRSAQALPWPWILLSFCILHYSAKVLGEFSPTADSRG